MLAWEDRASLGRLMSAGVEVEEVQELSFDVRPESIPAKTVSAPRQNAGQIETRGWTRSGRVAVVPVKARTRSTAVRCGLEDVLGARAVLESVIEWWLKASWVRACSTIHDCLAPLFHTLTRLTLGLVSQSRGSRTPTRRLARLQPFKTRTFGHEERLKAQKMSHSRLRHAHFTRPRSAAEFWRIAYSSTQTRTRTRTRDFFFGRRIDTATQSRMLTFSIRDFFKSHESQCQLASPIVNTFTLACTVNHHRRSRAGRDEEVQCKNRIGLKK